MWFMMMWQPIDTAPKDCDIILYDGYEPTVCLGRWDDDDGRWRAGRGYSFWKQPTHWMPFEVPV